MESILQDSMLEDLDEKTIRTAFAYGRSLKEQQKAARGKSGPSQSQSDSSPRRGESQAESGGPKGGVSYDGGTVDGVKLRAVNRNRLTPKQRAQIRVVDALGRKFGIEFRLFESSLGKNGRYQSAYGMYKDGVIYLDVNAGRLGQSMGQVALVRTAAHELTHYIQDYAEERYQELQEFLLDYLAEWKGKDLGQLVAEKMQRDRTGKLTPEEALDEVVADGCEMMLRRTKVMQAMAEQKPGLFQAVKEWMQEWIQAVKEAFLGVSEVHDEARAVAQMETERLEKLVELWDKGLMEASERAAKSPAREGGAVKYSMNSDEAGKIKKQLDAKASELNMMEPVFEKNDIKPKNTHDTYLEAISEFKKIGYHVDRQGFGRIELDPKRVNTALDYANTPAERAAVLAVPRVLKRGIEVKEASEHKDRGHDTVTFAGPVVLNGVRGNMAVVVKQTRANFYKAHRILMPDGSVFVLRKANEDAEPTPARGATPKGPLSKPISSASDNSISETEKESNTKFQERDELPDDRALLMQARAEGRNAESLTAYQKKVRSLEALERKLRRQQDGLEEARKKWEAQLKEAAPEAGRKELRGEKDETWRDLNKSIKESRKQQKSEIQKAEEQIRRAEKVLADMERKPEMRQELEKALHTGRPLVPSGYPLHRKAAFARLLLSFPFHTSRRDSTPILYSLFPIPLPMQNRRHARKGVTPVLHWHQWQLK